MKKSVRLIVLAIAIAMIAIVFTGCSSNQDSGSATAEAPEIIDKYAGWEILSVNASAYHSNSFGTSSCIVVTAIDADNHVHTMILSDSSIAVIETGAPYLQCEKIYANSYTKLYITKADLIDYLNN